MTQDYALIRSEDTLADVVQQARQHIAGHPPMPVKAACDILDQLRPLWDKGGAHRKEFLATEPGRAIGLSPEMVEWGLDAFTGSLDGDAAKRRLTRQFGKLPSLGVTGPDGLRIEPLGILLHVISGKVFIGPAESLVAGLLTGNFNIVKMPTGGDEFIRVFARSIRDVSPELAGRVALLSWPGGDQATEAHLARDVDGIVVAGGPGTIASYRRLAPPATRLVEFGPRFSVAIISSEGAGNVAPEKLALDVALWDQHACTAAQCIYVQGESHALRVAECLAEGLARLAVTLPEGELSLADRVEVGRMREQARFAAAAGATRLFARQETAWTVVYTENPAFEPSPLHRCARVKPFDRVDDLCEALKPIRGLLQTVGLAVGRDEREAYESGLISAGARRICNIGNMNVPGPETIHDGQMELPQLVRWVEMEREA